MPFKEFETSRILIQISKDLRTVQQFFSRKNSSLAKLQIFQIWLNTRHPISEDVSEKMIALFRKTLCDPTAERGAINSLLSGDSFTTTGIKRRVNSVGKNISIDLMISVGKSNLRALYEDLVGAFKFEFNLHDAGIRDCFGTDVDCFQAQGYRGDPVMAILPFSETINVPLVWQKTANPDMNLFDCNDDEEIKKYCELALEKKIFDQSFPLLGKKYYFSRRGCGNEVYLGTISRPKQP
jgi:hypothetical protein